VTKPRRPTISECERGLEEWSRHAESQIKRIEAAIAQMEASLEGGEDSLTRHTATKGMLGAIAGGGAGFVALLSPVAAALLGLVAAYCAGDVAVRTSVAGRNRKQLRTNLIRARDERKEWEEELQQLRHARMRLELMKEGGIPPDDEPPPHLPPATERLLKAGKRPRKRRKRGPVK
jgi:hypothetical protein